MKKRMLAMIFSTFIAISTTGCISRDVKIDMKKNQVSSVQLEKKTAEADKAAAPSENIEQESQRTKVLSKAVEQKSENTKAPSETIKYDEIQTLFLDVDETYSKKNILNAINDANLSYTEEHYNNKENIVRVAYSEGATAQHYTDSGDSLDIVFDETNDNSLMYMQYCPMSSSLSGLYYRYGAFFNLRFDSDDNDFVGYYVNDPFGDNKGTVITYDNGNSTESNYFAFDSKEDVLNEIIQRKESK